MNKSALKTETQAPVIVKNLFNSNPISVEDLRLTVDPERVTAHGDLIDCYRNLNRANMFSIRLRTGTFKGLVSGHARAVVVRDPVFIIGEKSRQRVVAEQSRNVHAYVRGSFEDAYDGDLMSTEGLIRVSYSPYVAGHFFTLERDAQGKVIPETIHPLDQQIKFRYAILNGKDVFLVPN